jgi:hypothetical protein
MSFSAPNVSKMDETLLLDRIIKRAIWSVNWITTIIQEYFHDLNFCLGASDEILNFAIVTMKDQRMIIPTTKQQVIIGAIEDYQSKC